MALHSHPRLTPAIKLREQILQHRDWHDDGTASRRFIYEMIARERGYALPPFGRPPVAPPQAPQPPPVEAEQPNNGAETDNDEG
jgi:hypothetical protein